MRHIEAMDIPRCPSRVVVWSVLATLLVTVVNCVPEGDLAIHNRLDRVIETLELIAAKQERLMILVQKKCRCCRDELDLETDIPQSGKTYPTNEENSVETGQVAHKQEEDAINGSKDFFHFNRLSANFITGSIDNVPQSDDESLNNWLSDSNGGRQDDQLKQTVISMGQHYESMFGAALEDLSRLTREQLASFRLSLNKLMNRVIDHNYQYNTISNQLALIKDECSLAASSVPTSTLPGSAELEGKQSRVQEMASNQLVTLRTSDISMIVRLLSEEFNQLMRGQTQSDEDRSEDQRARASWLNETKVISRRLGEIDSVVKQSAMLLTKLSLSASSDNSTQVVITYTNGNSTAVSQRADSKHTGTRWFAGSKFPGGSRIVEAARESSTVGETPRVESRLKCHSKTSITRPQSCRQLRMAGATCSGQYYVFVRGSIRHVVCDMNMDKDDEGGGWTVILRRIDKSLKVNTSVEVKPTKTNQLLEAFKASQVDFNLDWTSYKSGFGHLSDWGEFFIGLELLHELTSSGMDKSSNLSLSRNELELQLDLETSEGHDLHLRFDRFVLEDEQSQFRMWISGCNNSAQLCQPISRLDGSKFYTFDRPQNHTDGQVSCPATEPAPGWWQPQSSSECSTAKRALFALTAPIGVGQGRANEQHLYWPNWSHSDEPLRRIVLKVRQKRPAGSA